MHPNDPQAEHEELAASVRARLTYLACAEDESWESLGRGLTLYELWRVIARYPGDPVEVPEQERPR